MATADVMIGTSGDDLIDAGDGDDTIYGLAGNDTLFGWTGDDVIDGGDGNDWIFGEGGIDILIGGAGRDTFGEFDQWLNGDTITDFAIGDVILIRDANISNFTFTLVGTTLTFGGAQTSNYQGGSMTLTGATGAQLAASAYVEGGVQIVMTAAPQPADGGDESLTGTGGSDTINGEAGNDLIAGLSGDDVLAGGAGRDQVFGGSGNDILSGDRINGFDNLREVDGLFGGAGDDMIFSGYGDIVDGGDGFDTVGLSYVGATAGIDGDTRILHDGLPLVAGAGTFTNIERFSDIALTAFNDRMVIGDQRDPAVVRSWDGDDYLIGQEVSVTMYGGNGNDMLVGSTSNDVLYGENGNDTLMGYLGNDDLWGGAGDDRFMVTHLDGATTIRDFEHGADKIDVGSIDANTATGGDQSFIFVGSASFSGTAGELRYLGSASAGYRVEGDVNGDRIADFIIGLGSMETVTSGDFLL